MSGQRNKTGSNKTHTGYNERIQKRGKGGERYDLPPKKVVEESRLVFPDAVGHGW